jgi:sulfur carrier protein ThiS
VTFASALQRHVACPPLSVEAASVRDALQAALRENERARGYILDDQGAVRKHIAIFVNGKPIDDRTGQSDSVAADSDIYVMQALSGG